MKGVDRKIDPVTGDFVSAPGGRFAECDPLENILALVFLLDRGAWEGDIELGNRFAELRRATVADGAERRLEDLVRDAVQWLVDEGEIEEIKVTVERYARGMFAFEVDVTPVGRRKFAVGPFYVPFGVG